MASIYKITNTVSGKCYIGETVQKKPENRWRRHINSIKTTKGCPALKDAMKKYGVDKFKFEVILTCAIEDRHRFERAYIKAYNSQVPNGYNILSGGQHGGSRLGMKYSEETKRRISEAVKKFNMENPNHYETYREKHRAAMEKVDLSAAARNSEKFRKAVEEGRVGGRAHRKKNNTDMPYENANLIRLNSNIYDELNNHIESYNYIADKAKELNIKFNNILERINQYSILTDNKSLNEVDNNPIGEIKENTNSIIYNYNTVMSDDESNSDDDDNIYRKEINQKIKNSVNAYYNTTINSCKINIEKHRTTMANAKGRKIIQLTKNNEYIKEFDSISEAGRLTGITKSNIQHVLSRKSKTAGGYIWRYADEKSLKTSSEDNIVEKSTMM